MKECVISFKYKAKDINRKSAKCDYKRTFKYTYTPYGRMNKSQLM